MHESVSAVLEASVERWRRLPRPLEILGRVRRSGEPSNLRVGIDLVDIREVQATLRSPLRNRYLERVYTTAEIDACTTGTSVDAGKLAARFAAKEATMKALQIGDRAVTWRSIEVQRDSDGTPRVVLRDSAAALARGASVTQLVVSLSHEREFAAAVVVAT
jgi:holo-[acyl-carrier protein] synthase